MSDALTSSTSLLSYIDDRIAMPAELYLYDWSGSLGVSCPSELTR